MTGAQDRLAELRDRLVDALGTSVAFRRDDSGSVLIDYESIPASVQALALTSNVDVYSVTQVIAWDLALTDVLRDDVAAAGEQIQFGSLRLIEREVSADVVLHYSFPAGALRGEPLREFLWFIHSQARDAYRRLIG